MVRRRLAGFVAVFALLPLAAQAQPVKPKNKVRAPAPAAVKAAPTPELKPVEMPVLEIVGTREKSQDLPGSAQVIDQKTLHNSRVFTSNEALRKVAGVNVRDEEGFGLRPNISIRGLNPTRSTKILLLEDGIPLTFAPYGANESYYHPPVERFDRIEVLKGAGQNIYGPQTLGGVVNYITPAPPQEFTASVTSTFGSRDYFNTHLQVGGNGLLFDFVRKSGDGARDNVRSQLNDANLKGVFQLAPEHALTARINIYSEGSQITYSGITDAEARNFGLRYNPFKNDTFDLLREGVSFTHEWTLGPALSFQTSAYYNHTNRDWWRQASTTTDAQCGGAFTAARLAGTAVDVDACASAQGRIREYGTAGIEPRMTYLHDLFGAENELLVGTRFYYEVQDRQQKNAAAPTARNGVLVEDNERRAEVFSMFVQNQFDFGDFAITPAVRLEHVDYGRRNLLTGARGGTTIDEVIPSLGVTYTPDESTTLFGGVHRGFAPPRTEDLISNTNGSVADLDAEESLNAEVGVRSRPAQGLVLEFAMFRNDFRRQIAVGSIAGGSTPLAVGGTLYQGFELAGRADIGDFVGLSVNPFVQLAVTILATADQTTVLSCIPPGAAGCVGGNVPGSAPGNRLPYAPNTLVTATVGVENRQGFDARIETVYVDDQFSDFANTVDAPFAGNGQAGRIHSYTVVNAAANYTIRPLNVTLFLAAKNLLDESYIVDRTRGILPGTPQLFQGGFEYRFF